MSLTLIPPDHKKNVRRKIGLVKDSLRERSGETEGGENKKFYYYSKGKERNEQIPRKNWESKQ